MSKNTPSTDTVERKTADTSRAKSAPTRSSGKGIALLALVVALGIGGAGHYLVNGKFAQVQTQIDALKGGTTSADQNQIAALTGEYQKAVAAFQQVQAEQNATKQQLAQLQQQLLQLTQRDPNNQLAWKAFEAESLLKNAQRQLANEQDVQTAAALLREADQLLTGLNQPNALAVRQAITTDLAQLAQVNNVNQTRIMQNLSALALEIDSLPLLETQVLQVADNKAVSDSVKDWKANVQKTVGSFLDHFIRISDRTKADAQAVIAPNQAVYLRENLRLRLEIAMLAVPRQQQALYQQSLETVEKWLHGYFNTDDQRTQSVLKALNTMKAQSIEMRVPSELASVKAVNALIQALPKTASQPVAPATTTPTDAPAATNAQNNVQNSAQNAGNAKSADATANNVNATASQQNASAASAATSTPATNAAPNTPANNAAVKP